MKNKYSANTLQEDLNSLGIGGLSEDVMASVALGVPLAEKACARDMDDEEDDDEEDEDGEDYEESRHDPMDGPFVTHTLFDRIMALPFERLEANDIDRVIDGLKTKRIPRNINGITERAEEVARHLISEIAAKRVRRARAHSMSKKASFSCPQGYRKDPKDPNGKRCIRAAVAAGGAGKLAMRQRKAKKWSRSGSGKKSSRISARWAERRPGSESFAVELEHLLSEHDDRNMTVRDEILGRISNIVEMIAFEFDDESVASVFEEAMDSLAASYDAGRLDEDVMDADAFMVEIRPVMALISKSLDRLDTVGSGN